MGNQATTGAGVDYRARLVAALETQKQEPAPKPATHTPATHMPAAPKPAKDTASSSATGKASGAIVIFDYDKGITRAPTADEAASIKAGGEGATRFVASTENGKPVLDVITEKDYQDILHSIDQQATAKKAAKTEKRINTVVSTGIGVATDGVLAYRLYQGAKTVNTGVQVAKALSTGASVAKVAGSGLGLVGGKIIPGAAVVFGAYGIYQDVNHWKDTNNKKHGDDVARIAGGALSVAGAGTLLAVSAGFCATGVGAPIGLAIGAVGLIVGGIGMWFDDND